MVGWLVGGTVAGEDGKWTLMSRFVNKETRFQKFRWRRNQDRAGEIGVLGYSRARKKSLKYDIILITDTDFL